MNGEGSMSQRDNISPYKGRNHYSKSYNNIEITNQLFTQQELRNKINSLYEQKKYSYKNNSKKVSLSSEAIFSFFSQNQMGKKQTKNLSINKELNMKAMNKAIAELEDAEYENDKHMFDPNLERIKKKRRIKQKLVKLLIKCAKMSVKAKDINAVSVFSTVPYENKGSYAFIECIKKGQDQLVLQQLEQNPYYISDFDLFRLTGLHHACKKGNINLVKLLISKGSEINAKDSMGRTPLFYALINENKPLIKQLLYMKCSPWSGDSFLFLKQNLPQQILRILQFAKELNIICMLQRNKEVSKKIWSKQIEYLESM